MTRKDYKIIAGALNHVYKMVKPQEGEGNEEAKKQIEIVKQQLIRLVKHYNLTTIDLTGLSLNKRSIKHENKRTNKRSSTRNRQKIRQVPNNG